ncbi:hypothetical protein K140096H11_29830 [Bacteroides intestinalis]|jgi:ABC polyamine/opine transporter, periplasmic binding protein|uniref:Uncharacterized protein n=1 Tax=Bacteroides intestinalis TaxID=329854 RepID=A0A6N2XHY2_9BACE|nr:MULTISPECIES: hypothetical protein [Bacteroides]RHL10372.1 hypothetical protein DW036_07650 [Bacteroides sp. AF39-11AC]DAL33231.1 MAG TPA_asm: tail protein [Bacteriophage sp.]DAZ53237.1 MAG TPA: tail protein [Caudoviricetes sp.]
MAELIINNKDALKEWGVRMGNSFFDVLGAPVSLKEFIENKSRLEHGKEVVVKSPKLDERELALTFTIQGSSPEDYQRKKKAFSEELYKGAVDIQVPDNSSDIYHLVYLGKSVSYAQSLDRTFGKITSKFCEPNPSIRG